MDDLKVQAALKNAEDALEANAVLFPQGESVLVWESDLKVLMEAARKGLNGKSN